MQERRSVPALATLLRTAEAVAAQEIEIDPCDSVITRFPVEIAEWLRGIRSGEELTDEVRQGLAALYEEWQGAGFPMPEEPADDDQVHEGDFYGEWAKM